MQVKFRGKRKGGNEWLIGDLSHVNGGTYIIPTENAPLNSPDWFEVEPSSIGMFTGSTDKNGKEIYGAVGEKGGDVIKISEGHVDWTTEKMVVLFECAAFSFIPILYKGYKRPISFTAYKDQCQLNGVDGEISKHIEIIGNAFDNPELLEK